MVYLSFVGFAVSVTGTYYLRYFVGKTEGAEHIAVVHHSSVHTCEDDTSTSSVWVALRNKLKEIHQKKSRNESP